MVSINALNGGYIAASLLWIVYESYIVFDHLPFLFTQTVYKSPSFNYRYISPIFFWGLESAACIVATQSIVGAPSILLYNAGPHMFFVVAHINETATSKAFEPENMKVWWVCLQVAVDNSIHLTCLWHHVKYVTTATGLDCSLALWINLVTSMILLTYWVHRDEVSWKYFFDIFQAKMQ